MFRVVLLAIGLAAVELAVALWPGPVFAQTGFAPAAPYYATSPGGAQSPVQQQIQENYRLQLLQTQREMLLQNPSGLGREQLEVTRQLNTYAAPPAIIGNAAPPAAARPLPPTVYRAVPEAYRAVPSTHRHAARHPAPARPNSDAAPPR